MPFSAKSTSEDGAAIATGLPETGRSHSDISAPVARGSPVGSRKYGATSGVTETGTERAAPSYGTRPKEWFGYIKTKQFYITLAIGQVLALCLTGTNTFSSLLVGKGNSIPAFQTLINYILLCLVWTGVTIRKRGFKGWCKLLLKDGWKYLILSFLDVEGNYFTLLGYRYTTILSMTLINFWAIVMVVAVSSVFLHVRYHLTQYAGILVCICGMGILLASDKITGWNQYSATNQLKGDLFALLGATFYGLANCFEEWWVSKRPMYEVVGMMGFFGMLINGTQAAIFDRASWRAAKWDGQVGGYIAGYNILLFIFYSIAPLLFRLASAAFLNISLLTINFWGLIIGLRLFGLHVHWMYPVAFVLIICGLFVYFMTESVLGDAKKPWLGENQEEGVSGLGTAKRRVENPNVIV